MQNLAENYGSCRIATNFEMPSAPNLCVLLPNPLEEEEGVRKEDRRDAWNHMMSGVRQERLHSIIAFSACMTDSIRAAPHRTLEIGELTHSAESSPWFKWVLFKIPMIYIVTGIKVHP